MRDLSLEASYAWISKTHPVFRVAVCAMASIVCALLQTIPEAIAAFTLCLILLVSCRFPAKSILSRFWAVNVFIVFLWLFLPWSVKGESIEGIAFVTREGVTLCALLTLKANSALCVLIACLASLRFNELTKALKTLRCPEKLIALFIFTMRGISLIANAYERLFEAAKLRAFKPETNLRTYKTYAGFLFSLVLLIFHQARRHNEAMRLKGFDGVIRFLAPEATPLSVADGVLAVWSASFAIAIFWLYLR